MSILLAIFLNADVDSKVSLCVCVQHIMAAQLLVRLTSNHPSDSLCLTMT